MNQLKVEARLKKFKNILDYTIEHLKMHAWMVQDGQVI